MEVCNIPICHYYECKFSEYKNKNDYLLDKIEYPNKGFFKYKNKNYYWKLELDSMQEIKRDKHGLMIQKIYYLIFWKLQNEITNNNSKNVKNVKEMII